MSTPVLFDLPGPRARARIRIATIVGGLLVLAVIAFVLWRLGGNGQLDPARWSVLTDPRTGVPQALGEALVRTLQVAAVGMVLATALGLLLAVGRLSDHRWLRIPSATFIEFFRAIPLLVVIFALYFVLPKFGAEISAFAALTGGLVLYNASVLAEIFRAGILSVDRGQREAAFGLGMRKGQVMTLVLLPQAIRRMLPVLVAQLVVLLKDSSLGFIIGYFELLRQARSLVEFFTPRFGNEYTFQLYVAAGLIYIVINVLLSQVAKYVEKRTRRNRKTAATSEVAASAEAPVGTPAGPA
ncbi:amino acid ABC transporter membrane protein 2, PAAT family [Geodermatophilus obscurus]|jgi:glutamate transport system permease protein|uniref:Amino acid ABC transporter membrane protein 2, PAAT family n=1 Tax=Geodermatophilus obscurus TaxID=1861 RepID=A0A1I5H7D2_9ACTN|nr:amino acid ABC transporter permease [Geodermatophilus obscurus]SFO44174.1 amino acid ABC transporter membrane protein 2, PAAT family [Geodermatophilus obscurus]